VSGDPPWEWVDGNRAGPALFAVFYGVALGAAILALLADTLQILEMGSIISGPAVPPWATSPVVLLPVLAAAFLVIFWPRHFPIVRHLGISPAGLRLVFTLRKVTVNWRSVRWVGIDSVTMETRYGYHRYRLTANQGQRLNRFAQPR
jgi:hypothetical protein